MKECILQTKIEVNIWIAGQRNIILFIFHDNKTKKYINFKKKWCESEWDILLQVLINSL